MFFHRTINASTYELTITAKEPINVELISQIIKRNQDLLGIKKYGVTRISSGNNFF